MTDADSFAVDQLNNSGTHDIHPINTSGAEVRSQSNSVADSNSHNNHHHRTTNKMGCMQRLIYFFRFQGGFDILILIVVLILGMLVPKLTLDELQPWDARIPGQSIRVQYRHPTNNDTYVSTQFLIDPHYTAPLTLDETVDQTVLILCNALVPFVIIVVFLLMLVCLSPNHFQWQWIWCEVISFAYALVLAFCPCYWTTQMLKFLVSSTRPDFYGRCAIDNESNHDSNTHRSCTAIVDEKHLSYAWKAFPSGHSAYTFCAMTVTVYFLWGKLAILKPMRIPCLHTYFDYETVVYLLMAFPWIIASYVSYTRVADLLHFPTDVLGGIAIGYLCARMAYQTQYAIHSPFSYRNLRLPSIQSYLNRYPLIKQCVYPMLRTIESPNFLYYQQTIYAQKTQTQKNQNQNNNSGSMNAKQKPNGNIETTVPQNSNNNSNNNNNNNSNIHINNNGDDHYDDTNHQNQNNNENWNHNESNIEMEENTNERQTIQASIEKEVR